uniref:ATP-binding cassette, sub-family C (CFTR/MRP), member 4 n=1 Tax=Sphaeramia orbicularis TaxID=375764 RepID=A0A672ZTZ8_9TELE
MIVYFENYDSDDMTALYETLGYAAGLSICSIGLTLLHHLYFYHVQRAGMKIRVAMCHMIYKKALCLSSAAMGKTTTGQIVNLLSNDVSKFDEQCLFLIIMSHNNAVYMFVSHDGSAVNKHVCKLKYCPCFVSVRSKTAVLTDSSNPHNERSVSGIRIIKMYAWEKPLLLWKEISKIMKSSYLRGLNMASFFCASKIIVFITFTLYVLLGNKMSASRVFVTVSLYTAVRLPAPSSSHVPLRSCSRLVSAFAGSSLDAPSLQNVSFTLNSQQLLAVIGPVGAGKVSHLLEQKPVRIVLFSYLIPAFWQDLELLPDGDMTLIGDRGATLSGGQKARVNLARAVYQDADIYLLDDPLSAVDAEVGRHLFEKYVYIHEQTSYLVTHQLQYLKAADQIIVLKEVSVNYIFCCCVFIFLYTEHVKPAISFHAVNTTMPLVVFTGLTAATIIFGFMRNLFLFNVLVRCAQALHNRMFNSILRTPVRFFDINPIGRILNRFSKDIGMLDSNMPWTFVDFIQVFLQILGVICVAASVIPLILVPVIPLLGVFLWLRRYFLRTSRDIKRLESTTRSPVFSHLSSSLQGLWTIRAFGAEERFQKTFDAHQDLHSGAWFLFLTTSRWFAVRLDGICSIFVTVTTFGCLLLRHQLDAGSVGLALSYAVTLMGMFQWGVRQSAEVENMMTSVERVVEYTELENEAPWETQKRPPPDWPSNGLVKFDGVSFSYSPRVSMFPVHQVGIVGRTVAGKSSLVSALFRLAEPKGRIYIDGILTSEIGLHDLRQKMSIIPQDPVLFTGSMRKNLDPFNQHTDEELWNALQEVRFQRSTHLLSDHQVLHQILNILLVLEHILVKCVCILCYLAGSHGMSYWELMHYHEIECVLQRSGASNSIKLMYSKSCNDLIMGQA